MKKKLLLIALLATGVVLGQDGLWKRTNTNHRTLIEYKTQLPEKNLFDLNIDLIRKQLSKSPNRFGRSSSSTVISLPNAGRKVRKI
nr:hypothetical protein [Flavobacterium covae]